MPIIINKHYVYAEDFDFVYNLLRHQRSVTYQDNDFYNFEKYDKACKLLKPNVNRKYVNIEKLKDLIKEEIESTAEFYYLDYVRNLPPLLKDPEIKYVHGKLISDVRKEYNIIKKWCYIFNVPVQEY